MGEPGVRYSSLPGNWLSPVKTWMGADHLMVTRRSFFREEYRRFYFSDIQAIIVRQTASGMAWAIVLAAVTALVLLIWLATAPSNLALCVISSLLILLVAWSFAKGPTCECHLRTAANLQRLPSIGRTKKARRFLDIIRPAIRGVQGELSDEDIRARLNLAIAQGLSIPATGISPAPEYLARVQRRRIPKKPYESKVHPILFAMLLGGCVLNCITFMFPIAVLMGLCLLMVLPELGFTIAAIVKQRHTNLPKNIGITVGFSMAYICLFYIIAAQGGKLVSLAEGGPRGGPSFSAFGSEEFIRVLSAYAAVCSGTLGLIGTLQFAAFRRRRRRRFTGLPSPTLPPASE